MKIIPAYSYVFWNPQAAVLIQTNILQSEILLYIASKVEKQNTNYKYKLK